MKAFFFSIINFSLLRNTRKIKHLTEKKLNLYSTKLKYIYIKFYFINFVDMGVIKFKKPRLS